MYSFEFKNDKKLEKYDQWKTDIEKHYKKLIKIHNKTKKV